MNSLLSEGLLSEFIAKNSKGNLTIQSPTSDATLTETINFGFEGVNQVFQFLGSKPYSKKVAGLCVNAEDVAKIYYFEYFRNQTTNPIEFSFKQEVKTLGEVQGFWKERLETEFPNHYF